MGKTKEQREAMKNKSSSASTGFGPAQGGARPVASPWDLLSTDIHLKSNRKVKLADSSVGRG